MLEEKDIIQINKKGISKDKIDEQLKNFQNGFPYLKITKAATIGDGIKQYNTEQIDRYENIFELKAPNFIITKFVPASGAATRMFKDLFSTQESGKLNEKSKEFFDNLTDFAFYDSLILTIGGYGENEAILNGLLNEDGLNYGNLPKGLIEFHKEDDRVKTPFEEHIIEGIAYANRNGDVKIHFTVSPDHLDKFEEQLEKLRSEYEEKYGVKLDISFSTQKTSTDTIAVNLDNTPFREENGDLLFRPSGHGALIENLNEIKSDFIFIKNIDNVVPDSKKKDTIQYKKALGGIIIDIREFIFGFCKELNEPKVENKTIEKAAKFLSENLGLEPPVEFNNWNSQEKLSYLRLKYDRPLRVCGMVKNIGEPGGGPFWIKDKDGSSSLQICESAQINTNDAASMKIFQNSTHFNPVDLVVSVINYKGEKYDLLEFTDPETGFISEKSKNGKDLKALELPGLWNGAMADWNTVFVEVPLSTFNPVKTVNDLLREEHQA